MHNLLLHAGNHRVRHVHQSDHDEETNAQPFLLQSHDAGCYVASGLTPQMQILPNIQGLPVACTVCTYGCCNHFAHILIINNATYNATNTTKKLSHD